MFIGTEGGVAAGRLQAVKMERYYRLHSHIYDLTRWTFLFGRRRIVHLAVGFVEPHSILEIGCGTGANLGYLAEFFPRSIITGVDISSSMLDKARTRLENYGRRVELVKYDYSQPLRNGGYDLILFSYTLTMMNPGWREALAAAARDLTPDGCLAVVDFHGSHISSFRNWMGVNHVRMDGQMLPFLEHGFETFYSETNAAYGGWWDYLYFVGGRKQTC